MLMWLWWLKGAHEVYYFPFFFLFPLFIEYEVFSKILCDLLLSVRCSVIQYGSLRYRYLVCRVAYSWNHKYISVSLGSINVVSYMPHWSFKHHQSYKQIWLGFSFDKINNAIFVLLTNDWNFLFYILWWLVFWCNTWNESRPDWYLSECLNCVTFS